MNRECICRVDVLCIHGKMLCPFELVVELIDNLQDCKLVCFGGDGECHFDFCLRSYFRPALNARIIHLSICALNQCSVERGLNELLAYLLAGLLCIVDLLVGFW